MRPRTIFPIWSGFTLATGIYCLAEAPEIASVNTLAFDIEYEVNEAALPLDSVRLWYTTDGGTHWTDCCRDEDRVSPIRFRSPGEGLFGFYFVLTNAAGASSAPPGKNTPPHQMVLIDATPPLVQLHQVRAVAGVGEIVVEIRWTAVDQNFPSRPVELLFGPTADKIVHRATAEPLANTGMFEWRPPQELTGSVGLRLVATDRTGQRAESEIVWVDVSRAEPALPKATAPTTANQRSSLDDSALTGTTRARERAAQLLSMALEECKGGQLVGAVSHLREAVKLDPQLTQAFVEMGGMLYRLGDLDRALTAYDIALRQDPDRREALVGIAKIRERKGEFPLAAQQLQTILRASPKDAEAWLLLGDLSVHQGDEVRARECYLRASQIDPQAGEVVADARKRLALMAEASRTPAGNQ